MVSTHKIIVQILLSFMILFATVFGQPDWCQGETGRGTGLKLATPEQLRGVPLAELPHSGAELPRRIDLSKDLPPPGNQGKQQSCVGWAAAYALKTYQEKIEGHLPIVTREGNVNRRRVFSPSFIYNQINGGRDNGSYFSEALNFLEEEGCATLADMPYRELDYTSQPSRRARKNARRFRISHWGQVNTVSTMAVKIHLAKGLPILTGLMIDEGFRNARRDFIWRSRVGESIGGHAVLVIGYDDRLRAFKLINSWGRKWGDGGYGWIDYRHFGKVANEGYVAKDLRNSPEPRRRSKPALVTLDEVEHSVKCPYGHDSREGIAFYGFVRLPPMSGREFDVTVKFLYDAGPGRKLRLVRSRERPSFSDINGFAVCGSEFYRIPRGGISGNWDAWIPYDAIIGPEVVQGRETNFVAVPVLFIDNFGVTRGKAHEFSVELLP